MRSHRSRRAGAAQLTLVTPPAPARSAPRRARPGRNARMAIRLEALAEAARREAGAARARGDEVSARAAQDRADGAARAAAILRAGPGGVGDVLAS
jgi:hypothetical protein